MLKNDKIVYILTIFILFFIQSGLSPRFISSSVVFFTLFLLIYFFINRDYFKVLIILLSTAIVGFEVDVIRGLPLFRVEDIFTIIILPIFLVFRQELLFQRNQFKSLLIILTMIYFVSPLLSYVSGLIQFDLRDYTNVILGFRLFIYSILVGAINWEDKKIIRLYGIIIFSFSIAGLFAIGQYFEIGSIINSTETFYTSETHLLNIGLSGRQVGTARGPNQFGAMLLIGISFIFSSFWIKSKPIPIKYSVLALIISFFALLSTGSRTSIIASLFCLLVIFYFNFNFIKINLRHIVVIFGIILLFTNISRLITVSNYLSDFLNIIFNISENKSFGGHWGGGFEIAMKYFLNSPIWGYGPAKSEIVRASDSEYYYILSRYGLLGAIWLALFYIVVLKKISSIKSKFKGNCIITQFLILNTSIVFGMILLNIGNVTISTIQLPNIYIPLFAVCFQFKYANITPARFSRMIHLA